MSCSTDAEIRFLYKDSIVLEAGLAIKNECQYLMRGSEAWKLNYSGGRFLEEVRYSLIKKNEQSN